MLPRIRIQCVALTAIAIAGFALVAARCDAATGGDYVVIVLDDSGSMNESMRGTRERRIAAAKKALTQVVAQIRPGTQVGILLLNGARNNNHWLVPLGPLNAADATNKIQRLGAGGGTPLGEALRIAADELLKARSKAIYGTYRLIVVTDGEATDPRLLEQYLPDILSRGLVVDAIGVDMRTDHSLATRVHSYRRADDEASLRSAIVEILAESRADDPAATDADFELLKALDEVDAAEIVKALATPNNEAVTGVIRGEAPSTTSPPTPSPPFASVPSTGPTSVPAPTSQPSFLMQVIGSFCTCMLPLLIALMIFITVVSRGNRNRH